MSLDYNNLYGISLEDYIKEQETTLSSLIQKVQKDILLLENNLKKVIKDKDLTDPDVNIIFNTIKKKQKHLQRLKDWKRERTEDEKI